jgi:GT2 family glycosyltransferase
LAASLPRRDAQRHRHRSRRTRPDPDTTPRLFSHYIVTDHLDGSYSTSNLCYRRQAILQAGGFDPGCDYWEDTDLGWRVRQLGWEAVFAREALIYHQIIALSPWQWLAWPTHFQSMPAKAARYPAFRAHLFLGLWVNRYHALFDLALVSLLLAVLVHPACLGLAIPYLLAFPKEHGLRGRLPPVKAALHFVWDGLAFLTLLVSSVRHWAIVL